MEWLVNATSIETIGSKGTGDRESRDAEATSERVGLRGSELAFQGRAPVSFFHQPIIYSGRLKPSKTTKAPKTLQAES